MIAPENIPPDALSYRFVRARGPGGQHVNKVSTAVELRVDLAKAGLSGALRARLVELAGRRATQDGEIVIVADSVRSQLRNREAAWARFCDLLHAAQQVPARRVPTRPSRAARERRAENKLKRGKTKQLRRKPALE